jgi:hypothetical protein
MVEEQKKTVASATSEMEVLKTGVQAIGSEMDALARKQLVLQTEEALSRIKNVFNYVSDLKKEWDSIRSKTITLNVQVKKSGATGGGEEAPTFGAGPGFKEGGQVEEQRFKVGGMVKSAFDQVANALTFVTRKTGGWIGKAMSIGQRIAGYGGGDRVRALLEPGEWVIRKEAVSKYGDKFMEMVNEMKLPAPRLQPVTVAQQMVVPVGQSQVKMQTGGPVVKGSGGTSLNITIAPRFMTGDRKAARQVAVDIKRALEDLGVRLG